MQLLFNKLSQICKEHPMAEKMIIVPTRYAGAALLRSYSLKGLSFLNLRIETITGMASENMQAALQKNGLSLLPGVLAERKMQEVIRDLAHNNNLSYFSRLEITPGVARILLSAVLELKEAGHSPESLDPESFVSLDKADDIKKIYASYERQLQEEKLIDRPDLLRMFLKAYTPKTLAGATLLLPSNLRVTPLERKILSPLLSDKKWEYLPLTDVKELKIPGDYFFERPPENVTVPKDTSHLGSIYHYGAKTSFAVKEDKPQVSFFHAYGESSEVREILRSIKRENTNFEDVIVYYTTKEPYARLFFDEATRCGLPVTFGEGIDVGCFRPGKLLSELIYWINKDYAVEVLHRLIGGECFKFPYRDGFGKSAVARELRSSNIGWGRKRYGRWSDKLPPNPKEPDNPRNVREHKVLSALKELLRELLRDIPEPDASGLVDPARIAAALASILKKRSNILGEGDARAFRAIIDTLQAMSSAAIEKTGLEEALGWIERATASLRVARSLPEPGSIHIDGHRNGIWTTRKRVFIAGLDSRRFPGQGTEDPVLLDTERAALGSLRMLAHRPAENLFEMVQLLAARESDNSKITLSFTSYDTTENRESSSSSLLLQVYRRLSGETSASYSDFMKTLGLRRGIVPEHTGESLSESAWWMNRILKEKMRKNLEDKVMHIYPLPLQDSMRHRLF